MFQDDKEHGVSRTWYPDGTLQSETRMNNGAAERVLAWDSEGNLTAELAYRRGKRSGVLLEWYPGGGKRTERVYEDDVLVSVKSWDEAGRSLGE